MAYYDVYDTDDNLVASNVYIDESGNGGGGSVGGIVILLWIAYTLSPFVMIYFCITTYFNGTDQLFYRICSALPMIICIVINLIIDYLQIEFLVLKFITLKNHLLKPKKNQVINENEDDDKIKKIWERRFSKVKNFKSKFLKMQKYVRYSLIFIMIGCIIVSILPLGFELNESVMLPLIGPLFAYSYLLGIAEYIIRYNTLKEKSWLIFVISLVGGAFVGYYGYLFLYSLEPQNPMPGEWYFSIKGLEVFVVLICILLGYEIGLKLFKNNDYIS